MNYRAHLKKHHLRSVVRVLSLFFLASLAPNASAFPSNCEIYSEMARHWANFPEGSDDNAIIARNEWNERYAEIIRSTTQNIYRNYRATGFMPESPHICLNESVLSDFHSELASTFYESSLQELKNSPSSTARRLARLAELQRDAGFLIPFAVTGHYESVKISRRSADTPEIEDNNRRAGFHRAQASIFMNLRRIPTQEWLIIFSHELVHALDGEITASLNILAQPELAKKVSQIAANHRTPNELDSTSRSLVEKFLLSGLHRGFLAELRAWWLTYQIYQELAPASITWLDQLAREGGPTPMPAEPRFVRALSDRFPISRKGIFGLTLIRELDQDLRDQWIRDPHMIPWGNLKPLVRPL